MSKDNTLLSELATFLSSEPEWSVIVAPAGLVVEESPYLEDGERVNIRATEEAVKASIDGIDAETREALWPDRPSKFAAFALISTSLEGRLGNWEPADGPLELRDGRVQRGASTGSTAPPSAEGEWDIRNPVSGDTFPE